VAGVNLEKQDMPQYKDRPMQIMLFYTKEQFQEIEGARKHYNFRYRSDFLQWIIFKFIREEVPRGAKEI
jgi:hypothetical protein